MAVDEQKMLALIASEPMIRTVVLADRLDCDIADIDDALLPMLNRGRVTAHPVKAPNNRRATGYTLSDEQRSEILRASPGVSIDVSHSPIDLAVEFIAKHGTITGAQLHAFMNLPPEATPSNILAEALADGRLFKDGKHWTIGAANRAPEVAPPPEPQQEAGTRVSRALAFIADNGTATDMQLRKVMGIGKELPATYLIEEVRGGRLHKSSWHWKVGPAPVDLPKELVGQLNKPVQQIAEAPAPVQQVAAPEVPKPSFPVASFRCGLWSDGVLEICRDGKVIAALSPDEVDHVAQFIDRRAA